MQAFGNEIVNAVGSLAKAAFQELFELCDKTMSGDQPHDLFESVPLCRSYSDSSSDGGDVGTTEADQPLLDASNQYETVPLRRSCNDTSSSGRAIGAPEVDELLFGANGRATRLGESVPVVGQIIAGVQIIAGNLQAAKRALARSTKSTIMAGVTGIVAACAGPLSLGSATLGWVGGAVVGAAAGELAGGTSQAIVEGGVYEDMDRCQIGTDYLRRSPAGWAAGVAVASTAGVIGASVGLHVDVSALAGGVEQKVASELTEVVAERATLAIVPELKRLSSQRRRNALLVPFVS